MTHKSTRMAVPEIRFFVPGIPRPGGSKKGFYIPKINRVIITEDNPKSKDWRNSVAWAASEVIKTPLTGPLEVRFLFLLTRPKGHFGAKGKLRPSAPLYPTVKPDTTKLIRSTEDAMKGIAWVDDAQIARQQGEKAYADRAGCWIVIRELAGPDDFSEEPGRADRRGLRDDAQEPLPELARAAALRENLTGGNADVATRRMVDHHRKIDRRHSVYCWRERIARN